MVGIYNGTCQTDKQMWSGMMTVCLAEDYGSLSLHQLWTYIAHCLA